MRTHRLTATTKTASIDACASVAAARAGSLYVWLLIGTGVLAAAQIGKAIISVPMIYGGVLSPQGVTLTAALALGIGGLGSGAIYAAAPHAAPAPAAVPPTIGLVQQASNLGQFAGPVVLGLRVEHLGWQAAPAILAPAALAGLVAALVLRRILNTAQ
jgi:dipeptide/tripeptide permease